MALRRLLRPSIVVVKTNRTISGLGWLVRGGLLVVASAVYGIIAYAGFIEFKRQASDNEIIELVFFIRYVLLFPGLIPLIVTYLILVLERTINGVLIGLFVIVPLFVLMHFIVSVNSTHASANVYLMAQGLELILFIILLFLGHRRWSGAKETGYD